MKRKQVYEELITHHSWAIPYGDLLTLLLAFFVVMYAISSVNEGKYHLLAQSISVAFNGVDKRGDSPVQKEQKLLLAHLVAAVNLKRLKEITQAFPGLITSLSAKNSLSIMLKNMGNAPTLTYGDNTKLSQLADQIKTSIEPLMRHGLITLRRHATWVEVEIRTDLLFSSGMATLASESTEILQQIASILSNFPNPIRIEGYTDNVPINTRLFPSNWELSAARAATVARLFIDNGVEPQRMVIMGWGEYRPITENNTPEERNRNRRVIITIFTNSSDEQIPHFYVTQENTESYFSKNR